MSCAYVLYCSRLILHEDCGPRCFFLQAEDGIRDLVRSRGLGDVYKRQLQASSGYFQAKGKGRIDLPKDELDFDIEARVVNALSLIHI